MFHISQTLTSSLLPLSKKIAKLPKETAASKKCRVAEFEDDDDLLNSNSDTFSKKDRLDILEEIKSHISSVKGLELVYSSSSSAPSSPSGDSIDWLKCLGKLGPETFNSFLTDIIPRYKPRMSLTKKSLVQLRRRVRSWFKAEEKPAVKGRAVVPMAELQNFVNSMKEILTEMKSKNFQELKGKVQEVLQTLYQRIGREFKGNEFSKHYWWEFQENHQEVKELWKALPQKRAKKTSSPLKSLLSTVSTCSSTDDILSIGQKMEVEDQMNDDLQGDSVEECAVKWLNEINFAVPQEEFNNWMDIVVVPPTYVASQNEVSENNWLDDLKKEWEQSNQITCQEEAFSGFF